MNIQPFIRSRNRCLGRLSVTNALYSHLWCNQGRHEGRSRVSDQAISHQNSSHNFKEMIIFLWTDASTITHGEVELVVVLPSNCIPFSFREWLEVGRQGRKRERQVSSVSSRKEKKRFFFTVRTIGDDCAVEREGEGESEKKRKDDEKESTY